MRILGYDIRRAPKAYVVPPEPQKRGRFTVSVQPSMIATAEVDNWKSALKAARQPYYQTRTALYDYYQDAIDIDPTLRGLMEKRVLATIGRKLQYVINDTEDERTQELIESPKFEEMRRYILSARIFWGMGLVELFPEAGATRNWLNYASIPIKHIDPYEKKVRKLQYGPSDEDVSFADMPTALFVGEPDDLGLLQQLSLIALWKRETLNDWAGYSQLAGTNFREVLVRGEADPATIRKAAENVFNAGAAVQAHNEDYEIRTQNATSSSQNETFRDRVAYLDDQMTKLVLGQTMTTEDGSSRSQAEVHERVQETIFDADAKSELDFFNYQFYEVQDMFDVPPGGKWVHAESASARQQQEIERDLKLKELGFVFSQDFLAAKYSIGE